MPKEAVAPNPELAAGPGGVATPTPEPGPTPTPELPADAAPPAAPVAAEGALKPVAELLKGGETPLQTPAESDAAAAEGGESRTSAKARIDALTREKWEARRQAESLAARLKLAEEALATVAQPPADQGGTEPPAPSAARTFTAEELRVEAERLATVRAAEMEFNRNVDAAVIAGRKAHTDFDASVEALKRITGPVVPGEFVAAALQTGEASEVIYQLGRDSAEADRILSLPPVPMAVALADYAHKLRAERGDIRLPEVSRAPAPIRPKIGGSATVEPSLETMSMHDFIAKRNEAERLAREARRR